MTAATESETRALLSEYSIPSPCVECAGNAFRAAMLIFHKSQELPYIYWVSFFNTGVRHAYLIHRNVVFNTGVTASKPQFADFDLHDLMQYGIDYTPTIFNGFLLVHTGKIYDDGFSYYLESLPFLRDQRGELIRQCLTLARRRQTKDGNVFKWLKALIRK